MSKLLACLLIMLFSTPVFADSQYAVYTAGWMRDMCSSKPESGTRELENYFKCLVYFRGFTHGLDIGRADVITKVITKGGEVTSEQVEKYSFVACIHSHKGVPYNQLAEMYVKFMADNPNLLNETVDRTVLLMLIQYYPCKTK